MRDWKLFFRGIRSGGEWGGVTSFKGALNSSLPCLPSYKLLTTFSPYTYIQLPNLYTLSSEILYKNCLRLGLTFYFLLPTSYSLLCLPPYKLLSTFSSYVLLSTLSTLSFYLMLQCLLSYIFAFSVYLMCSSPSLSTYLELFLQLNDLLLLVVGPLGRPGRLRLDVIVLAADVLVLME